MPFNVSNFKEEVFSSGFLRPNKFNVIISIPPMFSGQSIINSLNKSTAMIDTVNQLMFRIEDASVPSLSLNMIDISRYGIGPTQKQPYNAAYNVMTFTFTSDGYGDIWQFWYQWISNIFGSAATNNGQNGIFNPIPTLTLNYKSDYASIMNLIIYDDTGNEVQSINFNGAFPFAINDIRLNWGLNDQVLKISVDIAYTNYIINGSSVSGITLNNNGYINAT